MLRRAEVGEAPTDADEVAPGTQVTIAFVGDESDTDTFVLGSRELLGLDDSRRHQRLQPAVPAGRRDPGQEEGRLGLLRGPERQGSINVTVINVQPFKRLTVATPTTADTRRRDA